MIYRLDDIDENEINPITQEKYNEVIGRNGIIVVSEDDLQNAQISYVGYSYTAPFLRVYE